MASTDDCPLHVAFLALQHTLIMANFQFVATNFTSVAVTDVAPQLGAVPHKFPLRNADVSHFSPHGALGRSRGDGQ